MTNSFLTLRQSIEVMENLEEQGFNELPEAISDEADEEFMVLINKDTKTFKYIDHAHLMSFLKTKNVQITELKKIEQWKQ